MLRKNIDLELGLLAIREANEQREKEYDSLDHLSTPLLVNSPSISPHLSEYELPSFEGNSNDKLLLPSSFR